RARRGAGVRAVRDRRGDRRPRRGRARGRRKVAMTTPTDLSLPRTLTSLQRKLTIGLTSHDTGPTAGEPTGGDLTQDTDGAGKRRRITKHVPVTSYALKACHAATGRAFVAVWAHRHGDLTKAGKPRWSLEIAARGRHEGEHTPQHMTSQQLAAYAASR